jgi:hypothetical protein
MDVDLWIEAAAAKLYEGKRVVRTNLWFNARVKIDPGFSFSMVYTTFGVSFTSICYSLIKELHFQKWLK